ncbi:ABC-F family ATP-binding cassette domain-containing protein [Candidatus Nomurabacteria bacterium]|nr:ABC-F family ATP-binding cassette domain-containing protein [Candidatus Nomurabacteria bacterium]
MKNITVKGIRKSFNTISILDGVSFALPEGKRLALIGENGSGKSTLLRIVTGNLKPDAGEVFGLDAGCAYIAQDFSGNDKDTPREFLTHRVESINKAVRLLSQSGFDLGKDEARLQQVKCGDLSGGEKKKLEIVAGLASGSLFIAMDEPENHLDYQTIEWLIGFLQKFRGGLIFVSHDQHWWYHKPMLLARMEIFKIDITLSGDVNFYPPTEKGTDGMPFSGFLRCLLLMLIAREYVLNMV